jgi:hypothetical protein
VGGWAAKGKGAGALNSEDYWGSSRLRASS